MRQKKLQSKPVSEVQESDTTRAAPNTEDGYKRSK
jgi:hypothetical protein